MNLIPVLCFSANDSTQCERLLDWIAMLNNKKPTGHLLLVAGPDTHKETQLKVQIAAQVAFASVDLLVVEAPASSVQLNRVQSINHVFQQAASHAAKCYRFPFLWIEPDCVPLRSSWLEELSLAYEMQPKRFLGCIMASLKDDSVKLLSRVAIYPRECVAEMKDDFRASIPFELAAGRNIVPRAGKTLLIQLLRFDANTDRAKIKEGTALLHGDKEGVLLTAMMEEYAQVVDANKETPNDESLMSPSMIGDHPPVVAANPPPRRGRPPKTKVAV